MTLIKTLARKEWERVKALTPKRKPVSRKDPDPETEALAVRRGQMMRGR